MKNLKIANSISLPLEFVTQAAAILAKRRAGKSYTMRRIAEQLLEAGQQVVLVDPKGDQWGIRSSADGKSPGYPITILGGEHGDVPLEVGAGELVAKLVVEERVSVLLDLSIFRKHEIATFMTAFMENLYRLKAQEAYRTPVMLIIDEADAIAPQKPQKGEERMLGAAEDIVRRGGQRGIGCLLITQRSAVLNKNVLTQAQMLIVLRTIAPQDLAAMKSWIEVHGTIEEGKTLMDSLPSLPVGDAWFWSPGWPTDAGIFQRAHVLPITTFDSGATPKPGEKKIVPKNLADVDLEALKKQMAATIEKAKNDDPRLLKEKLRIAEEKIKALEHDPKVILTHEDIKSCVEVEREIQEKKQQKKDEEWASKMEWARSLLAEALDKAFPASRITDGNKISPAKKGIKTAKFDSEEMLRRFQTFGIDPSTIPPGKVIHTAHVNDAPFRGIRADTVILDESVNSEKTTLSKGARAVLSYLHKAYPGGRTKTQLWVATGYSPGGGFGNILAELTSKGLIINQNHKYVSTQTHDFSLVDDFEPSLDLWKAKLGKGARSVLEVMLEDPSLLYSKEELARRTGYKIGGGFGNSLSELTGAELIQRARGCYIINQEILDL